MSMKIEVPFNHLKPTGKVRKMNGVRKYRFTSDEHTMTDFLKLKSGSRKRQGRHNTYTKESNPLRRGISGLTPSQVLTIKPKKVMTNPELCNMRVQVYRIAKELGLKVETVIKHDQPQMIMVRLNQQWPVAKLPVTVGEIRS